MHFRDFDDPSLPDYYLVGSLRDTTRSGKPSITGTALLVEVGDDLELYNLPDEIHYGVQWVFVNALPVPPSMAEDEFQVDAVMAGCSSPSPLLGAGDTEQRGGVNNSISLAESIEGALSMASLIELRWHHEEWTKARFVALCLGLMGVSPWLATSYMLKEGFIQEGVSNNLRLKSNPHPGDLSFSPLHTSPLGGLLFDGLDRAPLLYMITWWATSDASGGRPSRTRNPGQLTSLTADGSCVTSLSGLTEDAFIVVGFGHFTAKDEATFKADVYPRLDAARSEFSTNISNKEPAANTSSLT